MIVHLEVVIGKVVHDVDGRRAGRLEEVHGDWRGQECVITHYDLAANAIVFVLRLIGVKCTRGRIVVPWNKLDFSDPSHPRLNCRIEELRRA